MVSVAVFEPPGLVPPLVAQSNNVSLPPFVLSRTWADWLTFAVPQPIVVSQVVAGETAWQPAPLSQPVADGVVSTVTCLLSETGGPPLLEVQTTVNIVGPLVSALDWSLPLVALPVAKPGPAVAEQEDVFDEFHIRVVGLLYPTGLMALKLTAAVCGVLLTVTLQFAVCEALSVTVIVLLPVLAYDVEKELPIPLVVVAPVAVQLNGPTPPVTETPTVAFVPTVCGVGEHVMLGNVTETIFVSWTVPVGWLQVI